MTSRVIAIDGPAGSGKSTTAQAVAQRLGLAYVESGALYRALTLAALDHGTEFQGQQLVALAKALPVRLAVIGDAFVPDVAGTDVTQAIRSERVTARVSALSAIPHVREWATAEFRAAVARHPRGAVMDGRDIGTVVFPDAPVKVYLTATAAARAQRRLIQDGKPAGPVEVEAQARLLAERDAHDASRPVAPLVPAADARVLDTTEMLFEEQVEAVVTLARNAFA